jgi:hypothetical protein
MNQQTPKTDAPEIRPNAAPALRWLMLASAVGFYVIIALALSEDFLPYIPERMIGYLALVSACSVSAWAFGWLQGRLSDRGKL